MNASNVKKVLTRAAAPLLAAGLLAGCAGTVRAEADARMPSVGPTAAPSPTAAPDITDTPDAQELYGSAGLLAWPSVLYSIYLDDAETPWTEETMAQTRQNLAVAVSWITEQAQTYNASPNIYYDDGENGLCTRVTCTEALTADNTADNDFYDYVDTLTAAVDTDALQKTYGTSSVGYLVFLPLEGGAYSILHYAEDGAYYLNEFSCLYLYDPYSDPGTCDSPAVYAHEILHLFGAADLYPESSDAFVTQELAQYVANTWPDAIMYNTYNADGGISYDHIEQVICPLTAYRLGLTDTFAGIERFPAVTQTPPGVFSDETWEQTDLGGGAAA